MYTQHVRGLDNERDCTLAMSSRPTAVSQGQVVYDVVAVQAKTLLHCADVVL